LDKTSHLLFFFGWDPPTSSSLILNLWVGPAHKLFSNRDKMSHDPRTVMRQIVTCDNFFLDVTFLQHCCNTGNRVRESAHPQATCIILLNHESWIYSLLWINLTRRKYERVKKLINVIGFEYEREEKAIKAIEAVFSLVAFQGFYGMRKINTRPN
jgi:hypothetical protein